MGLATLMMLYGAFVGMMLYLLFLGAKSTLFGLGYWLIGNRESCGWGARVAGALLMLPVFISILYWIVAFSSGAVTGERLGQGEGWLGSFLTAGLSVCLCVAASYILAEVTYTPYWALTRQDEEEEDDNFENLSAKEKKKKLKKLELKREKRRQREEQMRREREEEERRLKERHEQAAKAKRVPPPIPEDDDEDDYYRRRRR